MNFLNELDSLLTKRNSAPFLFIGSGFSRRYIGLENWDGLLSRFCVTGKPYAYFKSSANQDTPLTAKLISDEFYDYWWTNTAFESSRVKDSDKVADRTSPLRIEICNHIKEFSQQAAKNPAHTHELELLKKCDVDGVITTNWDCLIEDLFPDYRVFIGQKELLFSNPLSMAEIYKIHGCSSRPESLILTSDDYDNYNERNAYLASKLITIFVEHPIVFIGYKISDPNIRSLLKSISLCIGSENIEKLQDNLIFIDRKQPESGPIIETSYLQFDAVQIPVKVIKTDDFSPVYEAISKFERKLPARVLRFCKERVFELVKSANPENKIAVVDFDSIDDPSSVEIIFGLGVLNKFGEQGYSAISLEDLFEDLVMENKRYNPQKLLEITFPSFPTATKFTPIYKYLRAAGITSIEEYIASGLQIEKLMKKKASDFAAHASVANIQKYNQCSTEEFLSTATESEIVSLLPLLEKIDIPALEKYLRENFDDIMASKYRYHFRKIMAFYDWLKYGFILK